MHSYCFSDRDYSDDLNLALIVTGFDADSEGVYYTALTTFGKEFADDGYIKIRAFDNTCGIALLPIGLEMRYNTLY